MKQFLSLLSVAAWLAVGCIDLDGDEILPDEGSLTGGLVVDPVSESTFETSIIAAGTAAATTYDFGDADPSDDNIAGTTFDRIISIVFGGSQASVSGDVNGIVSVDGNHVTVNNTTKEAIVYDLSGTASDGFFKLYSSKKQAIRLSGLGLANPSGAAINNQSKKRTFVIVEGANALADGASYTATPDDEDEKAAFFSEGQLIFCGKGSLVVKASGKAGITSDDYVRFMSSPTVKVTSSSGHAVRGKDAIIVSAGEITAATAADMKKGFTSDSLVRFEGGRTTISVTGSAAYDSEDSEYTGTAGVKADKLFEMLDGTLVITNSGTGGKGISGDADGYFKGGSVTVVTTGANYGQSSNFGPGGRPGSSSSSDNSVSAKGIKFDGNLYFSGGSVCVSCKSHEGIESKGTMDITGGVIYSYASDDAINAASHLTISGGSVFAWSTGNDGMDSNGNCYIKGGVVYAIGSGGAEVAVDANTEDGYKLYVEGGTLVAIGGLERGASLSQKCYSASWSKNTWYGLTVGSSTFAFKTPARAGDSLIVSGPSTPSLSSGVKTSGGTELFGGYAVSGPALSGGSSVKLSNYSGGNGNGFGPGW
ncbi:MAG: carbohydrate-binding domain-containing protein [Bacteroidales bacterium]|nr:carbohydrate-binding domain-containing protein [Bacteroidales bacterium]